MSPLRVTDEECVAAYRRFGHLGQAAAVLGIHKSSLHERLAKLGVSTARARHWSAEDDARLRADYMRYRRTGRVDVLADALGRTPGAVTTRAYNLGLTDPRAGEEGAFTPLAGPSRSSQDDRFRVGEQLFSLGAVGHTMHLFVLDGDPVSKARARFSGRNGVYTPPTVREAEERWVARLRGVEKFTGNVALAAMFVRSTKQRIDVDNMLKLVADACTRARIWDDDSQVTAMAGLVEYDKDRPCTVLGLAAHESTMQRGTDHWPVCPTCNDKFNPAGRKRPKFCSAECRAARSSPAVAA